jgi:hypothetical protein
MSEDSLTPAELAMLFALAAEAAEVSNVDLQARYGFSLTGGHRRHLNDLKLVSSRKVGRGLAHVLEEDGWARCRAELTATPPPRAGTIAGGFFALLRGLDRYLTATDLSLADVFRPTPEPRRGDASDVESDIRAAYQALASRPGARVRLVDLRAELGEAPRSAVDDALRRMADKQSIYLEAEENQQRLTAEDRAMEVRIGRRPYHFLLIEPA